MNTTPQVERVRNFIESLGVFTHLQAWTWVLAAVLSLELVAVGLLIRASYRKERAIVEPADNWN